MDALIIKVTQERLLESGVEELRILDSAFYPAGPGFILRCCSILDDTKAS
jgi:hypothetical protein